MKQDIGIRYGIIIAGLVIAISAITTTSVLFNVGRATQKFTDLNETILTDNITSQSISHTNQLTKQMAMSLVNPLYYYDIEKISQLLALASAQDDITQVMVLDSDFSLVRDSNDPLHHLGQKIDLNLDGTKTNGNGTRYRLNEQNLHVYAPIVMNDHIIGYVWLTKSLQNFTTSIAMQKHELQRLAQTHRKNIFINAALVAALLLLFGLFIAAIIARNLTKPINTLAHFARSLGRGNLDTRITLNRSDQFEELALQLNTMAEDILQHHSQLEHFANYDNLTGLYNRRQFKVKLTQLISDHQNEGFAVLMIDIDDFKLINNLHGQSVGDMTIIALAKRLEQLLASLANNAPELDYTLARFTGDKFIIALRAKDIETITHKVCNKILTSMRKALSIHGLHLQLTASIGVAQSASKHGVADRLINNASAAMYLVKAETKNNYHIYNDSDEQKTKRHTALIADFSRALINHELELWYQPQYGLSSAKIYGAEALLRWNHPQLGMILPSKFLSLIEGHELTHKLGIWTLNESLRTLSVLTDKAPDLTLSINMSPEQLLRTELADILETFATNNPGRLSKLTIEVTETLWTDHHISTLAKLQHLKSLGVNISLDDFATGHSSISLLKDFPIDEIKLDQTFVRNLHKNPQNYALSQAITAIARAFDVDVVAEGVELEDEFNSVIALGCDKFQGFLFNAAMPKTEFLTLLEHSPPLLLQAKSQH